MSGTRCLGQTPEAECRVRGHSPKRNTQYPLPGVGPPSHVNGCTFPSKDWERPWWEEQKDEVKMRGLLGML